MIRPLLRVLTFAVPAAALAVAWLFVAIGTRGSILLEMDRDLPPAVARGFYPSERHGVETFAWIGDRAALSLAGLDRSGPWSCELRFRGGRPDPATLPIVVAAVDGVTVATATASNDFADLAIDVPARESADGLTITVATSNTFVPGPDDRRALGVVVDRIACNPVSGRTRPPTDAAVAAALGGAAFGAALALASVPALAAAGVVTIVAAGQSRLLSSGLAAYGGYTPKVVASALWIAGLSAIFSWIVSRWRGAPLSGTARLVILLSAAVLHLKLLGLLHPSKLVVDALFHAHRLDWVLGGRFLFTQGMPGGVSFPYAIGLYAFTVPWTLLTTDYVSLLRIVVSASEVIAGGLLYVLIVKTRGDGLTGLLAVLLYHCVPLPYGIVGNANMTNVFGQAVALAAVVTMGLFPGRGRLAFWIGAFAVCALAFLSHISTFTQLAATLSVLGLLFWWTGGEELRRAGRGIVATTLVAALFAIGLYYGHFLDVYRTAWRARTQAPVTAPAATAPREIPVADASRPGRAGASIPTRAANALRLTAVEVGWPVLLLAALGGWRARRGEWKDRLGLVAVALTVTYVVFLLASTLMRVDAPFERYAAEFVGRVVLATFPAAVILAGIGAAWTWRTSVFTRIVSALCVLAALSIGARHWAAWFS